MNLEVSEKSVREKIERIRYSNGSSREKILKQGLLEIDGEVDNSRRDFLKIMSLGAAGAFAASYATSPYIRSWWKDQIPEDVVRRQLRATGAATDQPTGGPVEQFEFDPLELSGGSNGNPIIYAFEVDGDVEPTDTQNTDTVMSNVVVGQLNGGTDVYTIEGVIDRFDAERVPDIEIDGETVSGSEFASNYAVQCNFGTGGTQTTDTDEDDGADSDIDSRVSEGDPGLQIDTDIDPSDDDVINVMNHPYNAEGNGTTDDTNAIQDAIEAAETGQIVYFPEPDDAYMLRGSGGLITLDGNQHANDIKLIGESLDTTLRVDPSVNDNHNIIRVSSPNNFRVSIANLELDGNKENVSATVNDVGQGIAFRDTDATGPGDDMIVENVIMHNFVQSGMSIQYGGVTFRYCTAHSNELHGLGTNTNWSGVHEPRPIIEYCHAYNNSLSGGGYGIDPSGGSSIVRDCVIEDNMENGVKNSEDAVHHSWARCRIQNNANMGYFNSAWEDTSENYTVDMEDMVVEGNQGRSLQFTAGINYNLSGEFVLIDNASGENNDFHVRFAANLNADDATVYINESNAAQCAFNWDSSGNGSLGTLHVANSSGEICGNIADTTGNESKSDLDNVPTAEEVGVFE